ncbi:thrombospondin type 3 repeat-containing protein [bacterium]|nr:thrombospondin type 3 repeat-containing protein [bacterium]
MSAGKGRDRELEGLDIFPAKEGEYGTEYDIHLLVLNNNIAKEYYDIYHYASRDYDKDGIKDVYDNCPFEWNKDQQDLDGDGIGDACDEDIDGDEIPNERDYCPYLKDADNVEVYFCIDRDEDEVCDEQSFSCKKFYLNNGLNPEEKKLIYDVKAIRSFLFLNNANHMIMYGNDRRLNFIDNCLDKKNPFVPEKGEIMFGIDPNPNADNEAVGAWVLSSRRDDYGNPIINAYWEHDLYYWQPDHDLDGTSDACEQNPEWFSKVEKVESYTKNGTDSNVMNEYLSINLMMYATDSEEYGRKEQSLRYCSLPLKTEESEENEGEQGASWGNDGYCTKTENSQTYRNLAHKIRDYSFSHGSDPKPMNDNGAPAWRELKWTSNKICLSIDSNDQQYMRFVGNEIVLNSSWLCPDASFPRAKTSLPSTIYWDWRSNFADDFPDMDYLLHPEALPEGMFISHFQYTLSVGVKGSEDRYLQANNQINENHFYNKERYARSRRWNDQTIGYYKWKAPILPEPERMIYFDDWLRQMYLREGLLDPEKEWNRFDKWIGKWNDSINSIPIYVDKSFKALSEYNGGIFVLDKDAETGGISLKYDIIENTSGWSTIRNFDNIPAYLEPAGLYVANDRIFVLLKNEKDSEYSLFIIAENEIDEEIKRLPALDDYAFLEYGDHVYLAGNNGGYFEMFEIVLTDQGYFVNNVDSAQKPSARTIFNSYSDESGIYLAGGGNFDGKTVETKRDIWKFDAENGWQVVNTDTGKDLFKVFIRRNGEKLLLVNQTTLTGSVAEQMILNTDSGQIEEEGLVQIDGVSNSTNSELCFATDSSYFWRGFNTGGFCSMFMDPEYAEFNAKTKIFAVDGLGKYLFAAHLNGINVYDISDPANPVLKSKINLFGAVRDVKVEGTRIFAASGNGIDVLKFDGSDFTVEKHIVTYGDSAAIRKYGKYLIIGDGQGLKKLDTESLKIVQKINTSGDVSTLVIKDGTIHLYDLIGLKRYDAETFDKIPTLLSYKLNPKLALTIDDRILVSNLGKVYELTYNGNKPVYTSKTGDIVNLIEGYTYNGYGYFPQGNKIQIAAMNEIVPVCGNGIVEKGEVCDGDSVKCTAIDSDYISGTAVCNSTCSGYDESSCEASDGWF